MEIVLAWNRIHWPGGNCVKLCERVLPWFKTINLHLFFLFLYHFFQYHLNATHLTLTSEYLTWISQEGWSNLLYAILHYKYMLCMYHLHVGFLMDPQYETHRKQHLDFVNVLQKCDSINYFFIYWNILRKFNIQKIMCKMCFNYTFINMKR